MIYIVRHGETDWNKKGIYQGHADIPLNKLGIAQAKEVRDKLKDIEFDIVFSSPLKRAFETAKIITNKEIVIDERLIERSNGIMEGRKKEDFPSNINFNSEIDCNKYKIELADDIHNRVKSFFDYLNEKYKKENILVVTHAGVSINIRCLYEGEPIDNDYESYKLKNCEVITYENPKQ